MAWQASEDALWTRPDFQNGNRGAGFEEGFELQGELGNDEVAVGLLVCEGIEAGAVLSVGKWSLLYWLRRAWDFGGCALQVPFEGVEGRHGFRWLKWVAVRVQYLSSR